MSSAMFRRLVGVVAMLADPKHLNRIDVGRSLRTQ